MHVASLTAAAAGLAFGFSLIVAIGPQNTFVLRQGLTRQHVGLVVRVCAASDVAMIAVGTGGAGAALDGRRWLVETVGIVGIAFLLGYGAMAARRAWRPTAPTGSDCGAPCAPGERHTPRSDAGTTVVTRATAARVLATCLAFTWLNPGVYVDTIIVLGPVSHSHGGNAWWFAVGAMTASVVWFVTLGAGARAMAGLFERPHAWQVLDATVALVMLLTAVRLAVAL